jgi:LysM repeat protein
MSATISFHHPAGTGRRPHADRTPQRGSRPEQRPAGRVSAATYRRRRAVVGTALAACVAVGAVTAYDVLAGSGSVPASAAVSQPARATTVAGPGDSLWSIAERHHGDVSIVRYVDKLVQLNGGPTIQAGQLVVLP